MRPAVACARVAPERTSGSPPTLTKNPGMRIFPSYTMRIARTMSNAAKKPRNLTLDDEAMSRGQRYSQKHGTSISRLVGDFLRALPLEPSRRPLSPSVRRLLGVAVDAEVDRDTYRSHLLRKHGVR